jgi:hypothetical protein
LVPFTPGGGGFGGVVFAELLLQLARCRAKKAINSSAPKTLKRTIPGFSFEVAKIVFGLIKIIASNREAVPFELSTPGFIRKLVSNPPIVSLRPHFAQHSLPGTFTKMTLPSAGAE